MDKPGFCINCEKQLFEERVVDGRIQRILLPSYDEYMYELSDGSKMRVVMCKDCQLDMMKIDVDKVMSKVEKGWGKKTDIKINKVKDIKIKDKDKKEK